MPSEPDLGRPRRRAYVWTWLTGRQDPVVAGALDAINGRLRFVYGQSYLERPDAVPLYTPELPLRPGGQMPLDGLEVAGCIADGAPDGWGRQVILHRLHGGDARSTDTAALPMLTYLLESGTDRIGANDFQLSPTEYVPRLVDGHVEEIIAAADRMLAGVPFSPELDSVLDAGSSVGGARPKAVLRDDDTGVIAKFSTPSDHYPVIRAEAVGMELARRVGLDTATTTPSRVANRDVLLVKRFDRTAGSRLRRGMVSALTILGLDEMFGRYATYPALADVIRHRFTQPSATLRELFARIVFNILIGNTDDHARNHAAFWDGASLTLTPAYDLCPFPRDTGEAAQAMAIGRDGERRARLVSCLDAAQVFLLTRREGLEEVRRQLTVINEQWEDAAEAAGLTPADRNLLWGRAVVNPYSLEGLPTTS